MMEQLSIDSIKKFVKSSTKAIIVGDDNVDGNVNERTSNHVKNVLFKIIRKKNNNKQSQSPIKMSVLIRKESDGIVSENDVNHSLINRKKSTTFEEDVDDDNDRNTNESSDETNERLDFTFRVYSTLNRIKYDDIDNDNEDNDEDADDDKNNDNRRHSLTTRFNINNRTDSLLLRNNRLNKSEGEEVIKFDISIKSSSTNKKKKNCNKRRSFRRNSDSFKRDSPRKLRRKIDEKVDFHQKHSLMKSGPDFRKKFSKSLDDLSSFNQKSLNFFENSPNSSKSTKQLLNSDEKLQNNRKSSELLQELSSKYTRCGLDVPQLPPQLLYDGRSSSSESSCNEYTADEEPIDVNTNVEDLKGKKPNVVESTDLDLRHYSKEVQEILHETKMANLMDQCDGFWYETNEIPTKTKSIGNFELQQSTSSYKDSLDSRSFTTEFSNFSPELTKISSPNTNEYLRKVKEISSRLHSFTFPIKPVMGVRQLCKMMVRHSTKLNEDDASIVHHLIMDNYNPKLMEHKIRSLKREYMRKKWFDADEDEDGDHLNEWNGKNQMDEPIYSNLDARRNFTMVDEANDLKNVRNVSEKFDKETIGKTWEIVQESQDKDLPNEMTFPKKMNLPKTESFPKENNFSKEKSVTDEKFWCPTTFLDSKLETKQKTSNLDQDTSEDNSQTFGEKTFNKNSFLKAALGDDLEKYMTIGTTSTLSSLSNVYSVDHSYDTAEASALLSTIDNNTLRGRRRSNASKVTKRPNVADVTLTLMDGFEDEVKLENVLQIDDETVMNNNNNNEQMKKKTTIPKPKRRVFNKIQMIEALIVESSRQYQIMLQTTKALHFCRQLRDFELQRIEAEKILLIATQKRQILLDEITKLEFDRNETEFKRTTCNNYGKLTITNVKYFVKDRTETITNRLFITIIKCGQQMQSSTELERINPFFQIHHDDTFVFDRLFTNFTIKIELYSIETKTNDDVKEQKCQKQKSLRRIFSSKRLIKCEEEHQRQEELVGMSDFKLCAERVIDINDIEPNEMSKTTTYRLTSYVSDLNLTGDLQIDVDYDVDLNESCCGFLTIGNELNGRLIWNRRWCRLKDGRIYFWNDPNEEVEDVEENLEEGFGKFLGRIDLRFSAIDQIMEVQRKLCARPKTLSILIDRKRYVCDDETIESRLIHLERYFLSADTLEDLQLWKIKINAVLLCLSSWKLTKNRTILM